MSNAFNTKLTPAEEVEFAQWAVNNGYVDDKGNIDIYDYDLKGAWKDINSGDMNGPDQRGHLGDKYKKPNHPTFSNQSQYHNAMGYEGGQWIDGGNGETSSDTISFMPSPTNIKMNGGIDKLKQYMQDREPGIGLIVY